MSYKIEMFGFDKVHQLIHNLEDEIDEIILRELRKFGLRVEGIAKKHISNQDLNWKELSESYQKYKINKGLSENIYVATSSYFQAITSYVDEKGKIVFIGIKQETKTKDGKPLHNIARGMEYGTRKKSDNTQKMPKRPLWQPTAKEALEMLEKGFDLEKIVVMEIKGKYGI